MQTPPGTVQFSAPSKRRDHFTNPYLLRGLGGSRLKLVWAADITDLPMRRVTPDGWQGPVPRQHFRGAALAKSQMRVCPTVCPGDRIRGEGWRRHMDRVLQPKTPPSHPWRQTPSRCFFDREKTEPSRSAGTASSLTGVKNGSNIRAPLKAATGIFCLLTDCKAQSRGSTSGSSIKRLRR